MDGKLYIIMVTLTTAHQEPHLHLQDTSKIQFSLQLELCDLCGHSCVLRARDTVMGVHVSPDSSHSSGDPNPPGLVGHTSTGLSSRSRCPGLEGISGRACALLFLPRSPPETLLCVPTSHCWPLCHTRYTVGISMFLQF